MEVRGQKRLTPKSGDLWFQVALQWWVGQHHSGQNTTLATHGTVMRMKTKKDTHDGRWCTQQSFNDQCAENGNLTEETQHGPVPVPSNIRITNYTGNSSNKQS